MIAEGRTLQRSLRLGDESEYCWVLGVDLRGTLLLFRENSGLRQIIVLFCSVLFYSVIF